MTLKSTKDLGIYKLHGEAQKNILKNLNSEAVGAIANETFSLLIPASCKGLRLDLLPKVLANLRGHWDIFFVKNWHVLTAYAVVLSVDLFYFYTCNFDLALLIMQRRPISYVVFHGQML